MTNKTKVEELNSEPRSGKCTIKIKLFLKGGLLASALVMLALQTKDVVTKYFEGKTTISMQKQVQSVWSGSMKSQSKFLWPNRKWQSWNRQQSHFIRRTSSAWSKWNGLMTPTRLLTIFTRSSWTWQTPVWVTMKFTTAYLLFWVLISIWVFGLERAMELRTALNWS